MSPAGATSFAMPWSGSIPEAGSVSLLEPEALALDEDITILQSEAYIERTYKILTGVQRKKARREGRIEPP